MLRKVKVTIRPLQPFRDPRWFSGGLWLALAIVLACALMPAGLPSTQSVGSAFSPSTTSVALRGQARPAAAATDQAGEAGDAAAFAAPPSPGRALLLAFLTAAALSLLLVMRLIPASIARPAYFRPLTPAATRHSRQRAPPAF